jgi:hypothetical protein
MTTTRTGLIRSAFLPLLTGALVAFGSAMGIGGCGSTNNNNLGSLSTGSPVGSDDGSASAGDDSSTATSGDGGTFTVSGGDSSAAAPCATGGELNCYVPTCPNSGTTSLTGVVYDPAGKNPIYNAVVFVPDSTTGALPTITTGTSSCNTCDASIGNYIAATLTNAKGEFTLTGVPATTHVPLVVQIGKWRREVFLSEVKACTVNAVAAADSRLPGSKTDGAAGVSMPQMAIVTGGADNLGCFLSGIGIDSTEWTAPHGGGRLDVYQGVGGAGLTNGTAGACNGNATCGLWGTMQDLQYYDIALLACEGGTNDQTKAAPAMENMHTWLDNGGKVFATHFHYTWFKDGPANGCTDCTDFVNAADWLGTSGGDQDANFTIDTSFLGGQVLQEWLANIPALGITGNSIPLTGVASSVGAVTSAAQRWIYDDNGGTTQGQTKYMTILTPIGGLKTAADAGNDAQTDAQTTESSTPQYCGKAVFSDLHAGGSGVNITTILGGSGGTVPGSCPTDATLTAQEAALEFLFFDLSACVSVATAPQKLPPPTQPQ